MLIGQAERLGGTGDVEQQRVRHDHEQDVYQIGTDDHVSENDRYLSVRDAPLQHGAGTFAKDIGVPLRDDITSLRGYT